MTFSNKRNFPTVLFTTLLVIFLSFGTVTAQVGIGTTNPQAMLDIVASDPANPTAKDGFLMPRVTSLTQNFQSIAVGTMVFYSGGTGVGNGNMKNTVYYYDGNNWKNLSGETASSTDPKTLYDWDDVHNGVVYWIDPINPYHYKIVSPYQLGGIVYGDNSGSVDCMGHVCDSGTFDSRSKTLGWIAAHPSLNAANYQDYANSAAHFFNGVNGVGNSAIGWSLPSTDELLYLVAQRNSINPKFLENAPTYTNLDVTERYWSSEQYTSDWTSGGVTYPLGNGGIYVLDAIGYVTTKDNSATDIGARFIKEIGR